MNWYFWVAIGTWAAALSAVACCISTVWLMHVNKRSTHMVTLAIESLGDTHMMGFEALSLELDRLKARVAALEAQ